MVKICSYQPVVFGYTPPAPKQKANTAHLTQSNLSQSGARKANELGNAFSQSSQNSEDINRDIKKITTAIRESSQHQKSNRFLYTALAASVLANVFLAFAFLGNEEEIYDLKSSLANFRDNQPSCPVKNFDLSPDYESTPFHLKWTLDSEFSADLQCEQVLKYGAEDLDLSALFLKGDSALVKHFSQTFDDMAIFRRSQEYLHPEGTTRLAALITHNSCPNTLEAIKYLFTQFQEDVLKQAIYAALSNHNTKLWDELHEALLAKGVDPKDLPSFDRQQWNVYPRSPADFEDEITVTVKLSDYRPSQLSPNRFIADQSFMQHIVNSKPYELHYRAVLKGMLRASSENTFENVRELFEGNYADNKRFWANLIQEEEFSAQIKEVPGLEAAIHSLMKQYGQPPKIAGK